MEEEHDYPEVPPAPKYYLHNACIGDLCVDGTVKVLGSPRLIMRGLGSPLVISSGSSTPTLLDTWNTPTEIRGWTPHENGGAFAATQEASYSVQARVGVPVGVDLSQVSLSLFVGENAYCSVRGSTHLSCVVPLQTGDTLSVRVSHTLGSDLTLAAEVDQTGFDVTQVL